MQKSRVIVIALSFLLLFSAMPFIHASEENEEPNQEGEVDFFLSDNDISFSPSHVVHLNDAVKIQAEVTRLGDQWSISWIKEGVNIPLGGGGGDDAHMVSPRVLYEGGIYKMWYSGATGLGQTYKIFYATSPDGSTWTKQGVVLDVGSPGQLDDQKTCYHYVLKEGNVYKMWYSGADDPISFGGKYRIFYATSTNGTTWTKHGLVLDVGASGSTDERLVRSPVVVNESGSYKMWYSGMDNSNTDRIHYATSPDGVNWTKKGVVLDVGSPGDYDETGTGWPFVRNNSCGYVMWYVGRQSGVFRILGAVSSDGVVWEKTGLVLDVGPGPQEDLRVDDAFILFNGSVPERMWYAATGTNYQIFSASPTLTELATSASVAFYLDAIDQPNLIEEDVDVQFPLCGCRSVWTNWTASVVGVHEIFVVADSEDMVSESNESNNAASRSLLVMGTSVSADAGPDRLVNEAEPLQIVGNGSSGLSSFVEWTDTFDDDSRISQFVNTTISSGSVVLENVSLRIVHTFDTDPGFVVQDDQPSTNIWWDSGQQVIRWYVDREDPRDHYEKLVGFLPDPITDTMDFSAHVDYMYWRADSFAVADVLLLQRNGSFRSGTKWGEANNTLMVRVYGGNPDYGDLDRLPGLLFDDSGVFHSIYTIDYDQHYWELFTTHIAWDSDTRTMYGEVRDPSDTVVVNGTEVVDEGFVFHKFGVGSYGDGFINDGQPNIGEGLADNISISAFGYRTPGVVISDPISPGTNLSYWVSFNMSTNEPTGTDIKVDILNESGVPLIQDIDASDCPLDLFGKIDPFTDSVLMLRANLMTNRNETAALLDWSINYSTPVPVEYLWDVNHLVDNDSDGNSTNDIDFVGKSINVTYGDNGVYQVHLTVRDSLGNSSVDSCNVIVLNVNPTVSVTPPASPEEGFSLSFNASAYDPGSDDLIFAWDWGDGSNESWTYYNDGIGPDPPNSPDVNPMTVMGQWNHSYGHGGTYLVNLTVVDDDGGNSTVIFQLNVSNVGPTSAIDITDPNPVMEGSPVLLGGYFDDPSWLDNHTVIWDFGDGQSIQGNFTPGVGSTHHVIENVTHVYGDDGIFQVTLNVTDDSGASNLSSVEITVLNQPPSADISCPSKVSIGSDFQCSSASSDPGSDDIIFDWYWDDVSPHFLNTYYNNGVSPDPYPSPGPTYPFSVEDVVIHRYYSIDNFTVLLNITDDDGGNITLQFNIEVVGLPETTIVVGDPKYVSMDFFITSSTPISFSVWDKSGEGIESTFYKIDGDEWTRYVSPFYIADEGPHIIYFNSTDVLGGAEETKSFSLIVDDTPPSSDITVGEPNYTSADLWISPSTPLTITSGDDGCGLSHIEYQLDGGNWQDYTGPLTTEEEGSHTLFYRGIDNLGNVESARDVNFIVDGTPPLSEIHVGTPRKDVEPVEVFAETPFMITSNDSGSGVKVIRYRIDSGEWSNYTDSFNLTDLELGMHTIEFRGIDNLDNVEDIKFLAVVLIEPTILEENLKPLIAIVFAIILAIISSVVALKRPFVSEDGKKRKGITFLAIALPFIVAELTTGILSLFISSIRIPPWIGLGTLVDLAILVSGIVLHLLLLFKRERTPGEEKPLPLPPND
ncbi:MAG: OmpL47-type beta-barrel domain-containing protein [Thermoplasmata archaeon]